MADPSQLAPGHVEAPGAEAPIESPSPNETDPGNWVPVRLPIASLPNLRFEASVCRVVTPRVGEAARRILWTTEKAIDPLRDPAPRFGESVWVARMANDRHVGVQFRWWECAPGFVLQSDLVAVSSNMLLHDQGRLLTPETHRVEFAGLIYRLPWQAHALRLLDREKRLERRIGDHVLPAPRALSPSEDDCLMWTAAGKTQPEIAQILSLSPRSVRKHLDSARAKLGCLTLPQAVLRAYRTGWL